MLPQTAALWHDTITRTHSPRLTVLYALLADFSGTGLARRFGEGGGGLS